MAWTDGTAMHTSISKKWLFLVACVASCGMSMAFTTCTVDPVRIGDPAIVICAFEADMRIDRLPIVAYHTKINTTEKSKIANCLWSDEESLYKCDLRKGLILDGEVSDKLRLTIEEADEDAQGEYICQKSPSTPSESTGCTLTLADTPVVLASTTIPMNGATTDGTEDSPGVNVPAIAIPVAVVVGVVIAAILVVYWRRHRKTEREVVNGVKLTDAPDWAQGTCKAGERNGGNGTLMVQKGTQPLMTEPVPQNPSHGSSPTVDLKSLNPANR